MADTKIAEEVFKKYVVVCEQKAITPRFFEFEGYHHAYLREDAEYSYLPIDYGDYHIYCHNEDPYDDNIINVYTTAGYPHSCGEFLKRPKSPNWLYLKNNNNGAIHHIRKDFIIIIAIGQFFLFKKKYMIRVEERDIQE